MFETCSLIKNLLYKWKISLLFHILKLVKRLPFVHLKTEKGTPFRRSLPISEAIKGSRSTPPPPHPLPEHFILDWLKSRETDGLID